jgi:peptide subunit release factor 1 (eRF1)
MHITRSAPGGWSQRRYQQRAENQWERNAAEVGEEVGRLIDEVGAAFVAVAGDVRAVQFLEEHLSDEHKALVHQIRGGRQPGDDLDGAAEDMVRLQANAAAERVVTTLEQFAAGRASARAVDGPDATFEALQRGLVDRLLVVDDLEPGKASEHCWISDEPMMLSTQGAELRALGHTPRRAPMVDAAIRAAIAQGGTVVIVPAHGPNSPRGGVGALLRG